ncbi:MAG: SpoIIE family protein phosphatase [Actinomycetota bacterium]|nr:SpoIIE family protein phosphatase [Actinomycetota bacterium]
MTVSATVARCRTLIGGFGRPGRRDLDFGERFIRYAEVLEWPDGVVVEDLSYAAHMVLHRLKELRPVKVVLVGAVSRGIDPAGTIRRYRLAAAPSAPEDVHAYLTEAVAGYVGIDHTLAVVGHWGALPSDTVVVEVEAADSSFGLGFSEELAAAMDELLQVVRDELGGDGDSTPDISVSGSATDASTRAEALVSCGDGAAKTMPAAPEPFPGIAQLFEYADAHNQVRSLEHLGRCLPSTTGLAIAGRFLPAGRALRTTGNWYDVIPLHNGAGLVMGDVVGRSVQATAEVVRLQAAVRALALTEGHRPGRLIALLDRLVTSSDRRQESTVVYVSIDARSGEAVLSNAGHCLPLLLEPGGSAEFLGGGLSAPLGMLGHGSKPDTALRLRPGAMLLLFTAGLVESRVTRKSEALQQLRLAVADGPTEAEALCDHVLEASVREPRDHDVSVLAVGLRTETV